MVERVPFFSRKGTPLTQPQSTSVSPFAVIIGIIVAATLLVAVVASAAIGSNVNDGNNMMRTIQGRAIVPITNSCDTAAEQRKARAYQIRVDAAFEQYSVAVACHLNNGDETLYSSQNYFASYSKGLPHDSLGHVNVSAYLLLKKAATSGLPSDWDAVPLAPGAVKKLTNPLAGEAFSIEGPDSHSINMPPAPRFSSAEQASEMVEEYWMALLRDVPFADYGTSPLAAQAIADLNNMSDYRATLPVTAANLFRGTEPGTLNGPYISQFLYLPCPFGASYIDQRIRTYTAGVDFITTFSEYLSIQNGQAPSGILTFEPTTVFIRNGRDLSRWGKQKMFFVNISSYMLKVHMDVLYQGYFMAALGLLGMNAPLKASLPYHASTNQIPFGTFGPPFIMQISAASAVEALKAAWFNKWNVARRLRPEVMAARIDRHKRGLFSYPIHVDVLNSVGAALINTTFGGWLLPQAYAEGSPTHPSYAAGHATVAGAAVTLLKALFDENFVVPNPVMPNPSDGGQTVIPLSPSATLTVGGELNKVAANIAYGRNVANVHYRSDAYHSLRLGEQVAIGMLKDMVRTFSEPFQGFIFTNFDGAVISVNR